MKITYFTAAKDLEGVKIPIDLSRVVAVTPLIGAYSTETLGTKTRLHIAACNVHFDVQEEFEDCMKLWEAATV